MEEQLETTVNAENEELASPQTEDTTDSVDSSQADNPEVAEPEKKSVQDADTNKAFAEMRRQLETVQKKANAADQWVKDNFGHTHGLNTWDDYQSALQEQQRQEERQKFEDAGLPPEVADKLARVDEIIQQSEQEKYDRLLVDNFDGLQKEYTDLVKGPEDVTADVWKKWNDGKSGISLTEAYELVNKQQIREHMQAATKQAALNNINGKNHIRENGGAGDNIDTTTVPDDVMKNYRQMFSKELRSGKMTEADFLKHYKKSIK